MKITRYAANFIFIFVFFIIQIMGCGAMHQTVASIPLYTPAFFAPVPSNTFDTYTPPVGYSLVWSDEFLGNDINLSNWAYETENTGWSHTWNHEWQRYTDNATGSANACINNGVLVLKAVKSGDGDGGYTSARMVTKGLHSWQYGRIAARIQVPSGQGIWPAFWLIGNEGVWPGCGEIDIMEMIGGVLDDTTHASIHWENGGHQYHHEQYTSPTKLSADWHYYEAEWTSSNVTVYFDGIQYFTHHITGPEYTELRQNAYLLLNFAIGGDWPGYPDSTTVFPQYMYVDWVRVYQSIK